MKRTLFIITALFLVLVLGLAACRSSAAEEAVTPRAGTGDPAAGEKVYARVCMTCHGPQGEGVPGLSQDMTQSELIASKTDQELVEFIKLGGTPDEPLVMLPKGGNPALTDQNLYDVVAHLRVLQKQSTY
jgi:mono/diheme cytochrome c family protein